MNKEQTPEQVFEEQIQAREEAESAADNIDLVSEPNQVELDDEIEPTLEELDTMNEPAASDPEYLEYSAEAVGYINREQQWNTYRTIMNYIPEEESILDFGCGRGDIERFNQTEYNNEIDYIGIDMNQQLIDAGNSAYNNEVDIRCVNWFELKDDVRQDWSINVNSNNMRYDGDTVRSDEQYLYDTIDVMYKHADKGVLILLSSGLPGEEGPLTDHDPGKIFNWVQKKYGTAALDHTISNELFLIAIYKNN